MYPFDVYCVLMNAHTSLSGQVAEAVRVEAARRQITAKRISDETGIARTSLGRRLRGVVPFTLDELDLVASVLGVPIADLLPDRAVSKLRGAA